MDHNATQVIILREVAKSKLVFTSLPGVTLNTQHQTHTVANGMSKSNSYKEMKYCSLQVLERTHTIIRKTGYLF